MNKAFEKILDRLEEQIKWYETHGSNKDLNRGIIGANRHAISIVQEVAEEYKEGWIPCSERLPDEHETMFAKLKGTDKWDSAMPEKISDDVNVTVEFEDGTRKTKTMHTIDGEWKTDINILKFKVIAWQPLPGSYK